MLNSRTHSLVCSSVSGLDEETLLPVHFCITYLFLTFLALFSECYFASEMPQEEHKFNELPRSIAAEASGALTIALYINQDKHS